MTVKFFRLINPKPGYYSHEDWKEGLSFKVFYSDATVSLYAVSGDETKIASYAQRFGAEISELTDADMETEVNSKIQPGERACDICGGTGKVTIPPFDAAKARRVF